MTDLLRDLADRELLFRSIRTALVIGTILGLINHYDSLGNLTTRQVMQIGVTYLVPFSVATYGQVMGKRQERRRERSVPE